MAPVTGNIGDVRGNLRTKDGDIFDDDGCPGSSTPALTEEGDDQDGDEQTGESIEWTTDGYHTLRLSTLAQCVDGRQWSKKVRRSVIKRLVGQASSCKRSPTMQ